MKKSFCRCAFNFLTFGMFFILAWRPCCLAAPASNPGSRGVDWAQVNEKIAAHEWAKQIVKQMKSSVRRTMSRYEHPPLGVTGWLHEYYCDDDARRLRFDPQKPHEHVCTGCGRVYSGPPYDDCWRSIVHSEISSAAAQSAVLFRITGDREWLEYTKKVLLWYADHFDQFEPHGSHAGKGMIREQSLDEATQLVRLAEAYWDVCTSLSESETRIIADQFLRPDAEFIHKQTRSIHNIPSWHNAAVGLVGFALGDKKLIQEAIDGEYGLRSQIQKGVRGDGFWFEGSISYHFYTISSLQPLYIAARAQGCDLTGAEKFRLMYTSPIRFAFPNDEFPAANDGWPGQSLNSYDSLYEAAASLWDDPVLRSALSSFYRNKNRTSINALLYGPVDLPESETLASPSVLFKDSGVAILRNKNVNAYLKFSPYGGGHDHLDRLNLILFGKGNVLIPDLGTSGYGIPLNAWYRSSAAHNLLVVDGQRQKRCGGYLISYKEGKVVAGVKDAYDGVDIQRSVGLAGDGIEDFIQAKSDQSHRYDLFYHIRGELESCDVSLEDAEHFNDSNGYDFLRDIRSGKCEGALNISWKLRDSPGKIVMQCQSSNDFEVFTGVCSDNPADETMSFLMLRVHGNNAEWRAHVQIQ
ncbi:MAG: alginate lyase family protein [Candidatus Omnitrophica bacterium]|nr:alginate lyase family protein [Candidatus Omnitrophota bacterium]